MGVYSVVRDAVVSTWLQRALRTMSKETMLRVLQMICRVNPGWRTNLAPAVELVQGEHPFYQWVMALRRDLNPRAFHRFVRNAVFNNFVADRRQADYEKERGAPPLSNIVISVTERCNLRCEGCWAAEYDKRDDLPYPLLNRIVRELKEMRASFVTFTDEVADRLQELGNAVPLVSINGFEADNDSIRGDGNFRAVSAAFDRLSARGIFFGVSLTATSRNMEAMTDPAFYDWMIEKGAKIGWVFQYIPVGRNPTLDLMISPAQRRELGQFIYALRNSRPFFIADFWNDGPLVGGCMAGGKQYVHITNRGDVEPCVFCHFSVDNIRDKSLHEVIRSPFLTDIRNGIPYDGNLLRPCMMVDRPDVFRTHVQKHQPRPSHAGAQTLVEDLAGGLDTRADGVREVMDRVWQNGDYASFFTFDPRWYNAVPRGARKVRAMAGA